jgi:outer membrane immunogenic protein
MKHAYLFITLFLVSISTLFAQNPIAKGQSQFNLGVGFSSWGIPIYIGLDHGVHKDITIGGEFSFRSYNDGYYNRNRDYRYNQSIFGVSGNANYHFNSVLNIPPTWDFYAGLNIGFYHWSRRNDYPGRYNSGLGLGAQIGGRYYFTDRFGLNLEFGGGNAFSGGKFGISLKL